MGIHEKSQNNTDSFDQKFDQRSNRNRNKNIIRFTHLAIKHLEASAKRKIFWCQGMDDFGVRLSPNGSKKWVFEYRLNNKTRLMTLGKFPNLSLSEATKIYLDNKIKVDHGIDPLEERNEDKKKNKNQLTVDELIDCYISFCKKTNKKSYQEEERALKKDMPDAIKAMKISEVPPKRLSNAIDAIIDRGALGMAGHFYKYARQMFNFAIDKGLIENNPCLKFKVRVPKKKRQRHLDLREIYLFWHNLENIPMCHTKRLMLKFLLCTVTRPINVRHMKWAHVNLDQKIWTLPTTKNGILHRVYLGNVAVSILKEVRGITGNDELVFGSFGKKVFNLKKKDLPKTLRPFSEGSMAQSLRLHFDKLEIGEPFYPYDLRRTGATMIAGLFGRRDFAAMALNHTTNDVTGIYDQYTYDREKKMMLNALNKAIELIITSPTVESVPDFETLRAKVIQPVNTSNLIHNEPVCNSMGLQAMFSNPVSYKLSYDHGGLDNEA